MPSEKRERQRSNRAVKKASESKSQRRQQMFKRTRQLTILIVVVIVFGLLLSFCSADDTPETESAPLVNVTAIA